MMCRLSCLSYCFFFFNDTATTEIYTLSLHDALPISEDPRGNVGDGDLQLVVNALWAAGAEAISINDQRLGPTSAIDRKSTRLNSSHANISYAVFCLKKKKKQYKASHCARLYIGAGYL